MKRNISLYINAEIIERAKEMNVNISKLVDNFLQSYFSSDEKVKEIEDEQKLIQHYKLQEAKLLSTIKNQRENLEALKRQTEEAEDIKLKVIEKQFRMKELLDHVGVQHMLKMVNEKGEKVISGQLKKLLNTYGLKISRQELDELRKHYHYEETTENTEI